MDVLDNKVQTHFEALSKLSQDADEMMLASPFLGREIRALLDGIGVSRSIKHLTLVTVLDAFDQSLQKPMILRNFIAYCTENNITYRIFIDESLHSKVYLFISNGTPRKAVITSANFTRTGLMINHETGAVVTERDSLRFLEQSIKHNGQEIFVEDIEILYDQARIFRDKHQEKKARQHKFQAWAQISHDERAPVPYLERTAFIKPIGSSEEPYCKHEPMGTRVHFAKDRPHVNIGDILFCYAVGPRNILGAYEICTEPAFDEEGERWPWYVETRCLTRDYSDHFWESGLTLTEVVKAYNLQYPEEPVAATGNTSLSGALIWGKDKIKLDERFADYLMSLIQINHMFGGAGEPK